MARYTETEVKAILAALPPEALAERQRIIDAAVRAARETGYCDQFNRVVKLIMPEMLVNIEGTWLALDSDGACCHSSQDAWEYMGSRRRRPEYGPDGYDVHDDRDRDGFNRLGYDREGFDAEGRGSHYLRDNRPVPLDRIAMVRDEMNPTEGYTPQTWREQGYTDPYMERVYGSGYGSTSYRDAEGNIRVGRPATPEEEVAEAGPDPVRFNPTTWRPVMADAVSTSE